MKQKINLGKIYWKFFFSYLIIILTMVTALALLTPITITKAFDHRLFQMGHMMEMAGGKHMMSSNILVNNLTTLLKSATHEAIWVAMAIAFLVSVAISIVISRQMVTPVQRMIKATQHIAAGNYDERLPLPDQRPPNEYDELEQLAFHFNQMASSLGQTEIIRRQLIGDVAHELRTPLTTIKGSMEGLIDGVLPPESATFQQIYNDADRLQRLVNDLQELSRVEGNAYQLNIVSLPIKKIALKVAEHLTPQFNEKDVNLEINIPENLPNIQADQDRIEQILLNLIGNALQYTPSGGSVILKSTCQNNHILISINDTGIGIPPEHLTHLFDRFYRVDKSRSRAGGGSGIGLTITKHLIEAHGGQIWVDSPGKNKGSTFSFTIPIQSSSCSESSC